MTARRVPWALFIYLLAFLGFFRRGGLSVATAALAACLFTLAAAYCLEAVAGRPGPAAARTWDIRQWPGAARGRFARQAAVACAITAGLALAGWLVGK